MQFDRNTRFPLILHTILNDAVIHKFEHIISWVPNSNRLFKIHNSKQFVRCIMKRYFKNQNHFKSFTRQLNLYGFQRIATGSHLDPTAPRGAYCHPMFIRGDVDLSLDMDRPKAPNARLFQEKQSGTYCLQDNVKDPFKACSDEAFLPLPVMRTTGPDNITCPGPVSPVAHKKRSMNHCLQDRAEEEPFKACLNETFLPRRVMRKTDPNDTTSCHGSVSPVGQRRLEVPPRILQDMAEDIIYIFGK